MIWLAVGALVAAGAVVPVVGHWRPRHGAGARARARSAHARLGYALSVAPSATGPDAQQRLAEATERWTSAGGVLAAAKGRRQYALAEQLCDEGCALLEG